MPVYDPRNKLTVRMEQACWKNGCDSQPWPTATSLSSPALTGTSTAEVNDPASKPYLPSTGTTLETTSQSASLTSESGVQRGPTNTSLQTTTPTTTLPTTDPLSHTHASTSTAILSTNTPSLPHPPSFRTGVIVGFLGASLAITIVICFVILTRRRRTTLKRMISAPFKQHSSRTNRDSHIAQILHEDLQLMLLQQVLLLYTLLRLRSYLRPTTPIMLH